MSIENKEEVKIVFMGTPDFARESLKKLVDEKFNVIACFTNPDKPSGRGMKSSMSEVKKYAIENNIPVYQPVKLRKNEEILDILKKLNPDLIVVVAYGKILPIEILELPKLGCINVHGSLLPNYRGAAPMQWAIINGEEKTGITTMYMDKGMDTGDMLLKKEVIISDEDNFETIHDKMKVLGANLLVDTLCKIMEGNIERIKQPLEGTIAPMIDKSMTHINFNKNAKEIFNFVRGLSPVPGTYMETSDGKRYKVYKVGYDETNEFNNIESGKIVRCNKKELIIKCNNGIISILSIQPLNSKKMDIDSFLAGNNFDANTKFI